MSRRGDWWANTGHAQAKREQDERDGRPTDGGFDMMSAFFHDVPPEVALDGDAYDADVPAYDADVPGGCG